MLNEQISVIIPAFNAEKYIYSALDTVMKQSHRPIEIIVVDDGSKDNTWLKIEEFCKENRICLDELKPLNCDSETILRVGASDEGNLSVVYIRQLNSGPSFARNTGIRSSSGELVAFLDVDDTWENGKLQQQLELIKNKKCDFVFTNMVLVGKNKKEQIMFAEWETIPFKFYDGGVLIDSWRSLIKTNFITTSSVLAKKNCFRVAGYFNVNRRLSEDWELWLKFSKQFRFGYIHTPAVYKNEVDGSLSKNKAGMIESSIEVLEEFLKKEYDNPEINKIEDAEIRDILFNTYKWAGYYFLCVKEADRAIMYLKKALLIKKEMRTFLYWFKAISLNCERLWN